jgi:hypothetical protein
MTDVSHQVEAALADMWYVEEALAHFATIYREAVYRYLDEHPVHAEAVRPRHQLALPAS